MQMKFLPFLVAFIFVVAILIARGTRSPAERYYTTIGRHRFDFELVPIRDGTMRIYILRQPSYGRYSADLVDTHRYRDGDRYYVCIQGHLVPRTSSEARAWADY